MRDKIDGRKLIANAKTLNERDNERNLYQEVVYRLLALIQQYYMQLN